MKQNTDDVRWMRMAIRLAKKGLGCTSPNPVVGAVIVKNGICLGAGWHKRAGTPHAEINAISSLKSPRSARGATLYVTLEPCCSFGRTPPCCEAIIAHGFSRVVVGCSDPNPRHAGRAYELLRSKGIEVVENICQEACGKLNEAFFKWIRVKRPFVLLKMAQTLDGKIATVSGASRWITGLAARKHVMELRQWSDAILAGANTYRLDAPSFTVRKADGTVMKTPRRFIASHGGLDLPEGWESIRLDSVSDWEHFLDRLGNENVVSLLIEGGGELAASALHAGVVDKVEFHLAPKILGGRGSRPSVGGCDPADIADSIQLERMQTGKVGDDLIISGYPIRKGHC